MAFDFEWDDNEERKIRNRPCGGEKVLLLWKYPSLKTQMQTKNILKRHPVASRVSELIMFIIYVAFMLNSIKK